MNQDRPLQSTTDNNLPLTRLDREIVGDPRQALEREWLLTNGIGGFGGASLCGALTRRYHGLLIAALQPPLGRTVLLSKLDEQINLAGQVYRLDVNEWRDGTASLAGLNYLEKVEFQGTVPTFTYHLPDGAFQKTCWMEYGANTVYIRYTYAAAPESQPLELQVRPLANCRDYHEDTKGSLDRPFKITEIGAASPGWTVEAWPGAPRWNLLVQDRPVQWRPGVSSGWYWGFHYRQEQARGLIADEDLYCLGTWVASLAPGQSITFVASVDLPEMIAPLYPGALERELARQAALLAQAGLPPAKNEFDRLATRLTLAADQFIVGRPAQATPGSLEPDYRTVIAGYPWFSDWGRDTMIALPGLTIATGRYAEAATILRSFARYVSQGMLPNRFPDPDPAGPSGALRPLTEADYNTVDATVWYFDAVQKYLEATGDDSLGQALYPVLTDIISWHIKGTRFGIKVDPQDGLLASGMPGVQLTWMDAKIDDWVVTPRRGKPIEISALWYRACRVMEGLASRYAAPEMAAYFQSLAARVAANFEKTYWYEQGGYFYDCIDELGRPDPSLRPNQAIALAVAPDLVRPALREAALAVVHDNLLTPYGLRTLNRQNPAYKPEYKGNRLARDSAYHQGTVWPWLLGPYGLALLKSDQADGAHPAELEALLRPFFLHIDEACVGQISEVFGAEPPFPPGGCVAQAWSVAQLLEIWRWLNS
jgi:predicted glycogen debranching enzyme